jgi:hypothetical protein
MSGNNTYNPRKRFFTDASWLLPIGNGHVPESHAACDAILGGWRLHYRHLADGAVHARFAGIDPSNTTTR